MVYFFFGEVSVLFFSAFGTSFLGTGDASGVETGATTAIGALTRSTGLGEQPIINVSRHKISFI